MADQQRFKDIKTGKIYSMKRINGIMVILETEDGLDRIWTRQEDLNDSFLRIPLPEASEES